MSSEEAKFAVSTGGDSEPEAEEPAIPARRHKQLIRRSSSFKKFSNISGLVNDWFFSSADLRLKMSAFAEANVGRSDSFQTENSNTRGVGGRSEMDLKATEVHNDFCEVFEEELESFLDSKSVSMEQFQEMFKIENDEEKRNGQHFYRWIEVLEFENFLVLMTSTSKTKSGSDGFASLQARITELSDEAKTTFRKQASLRPLLIRWCPSDFETISKVLTSTSKTIKPGLDKASMKSLLNWKNKLTTKVLMEGVYQDPPRDEDAWTRYLALYTSKMSDETFANLIAQIDGHVAATTEGESEEARTRRAVWECFAACDPTHDGTADLHLLLKHLDYLQLISEKEKVKSIARWSAKLIPGKPNTSVIPLSMTDFTKALNDSFNSKNEMSPVEFRTQVGRVTERALATN